MGTVLFEFEMSWKVFSVEDMKMKVRGRRRRRRKGEETMAVLLLVEKVVVDFDLAVGLKVIRQQHNRNRNLVQIVDLRKQRPAFTSSRYH